MDTNFIKVTNYTVIIISQVNVLYFVTSLVIIFAKITYLNVFNGSTKRY